MIEGFGTATRLVRWGQRDYIFRLLTKEQVEEIEREHGPIRKYSESMSGAADTLYRMITPVQGDKPSFEEFIETVSVEEIFDQIGDLLVAVAERDREMERQRQREERH